jgi:hypothetical protein
VATAPRPAPAPTQAGIAAPSGAPDAPSALRAYLRAANAQDLQAMSLVWGTSTGPARAEMNRDDLEKRELIVVRCLAHQSYDIISDAPGLGGKRVFAVALRRRDLTRTTNFNVVAGPEGRYYVESVDVEALKDYCTRR